MANQEHLDILKQGTDVWKIWRKSNPNIQPDLSGAKLIEADLIDADLSRAYLSGANLSRADLSRAYLGKANLREAYLYGAYTQGSCAIRLVVFFETQVR